MGPATPILRSFDEEKARDFFVRYLGFDVTFEHRFAPDMPLYFGLRKGQCELHISEHHGDATPGSTVRIELADLDGYHAEITARGHSNMRPGIVTQSWARDMTVTDPFGNKLIFWQALPES